MKAISGVSLLIVIFSSCVLAMEEPRELLEGREQFRIELESAKARYLIGLRKLRKIYLQCDETEKIKLVQEEIEFVGGLDFTEIVPDRSDKLAPDLKITEGVGYGPFRVGATREELIRSLGQPDPGSTKRWVQWKRKHSIHCLIDEGRGAFELRFDRGFKQPLASGIRIGSSVKDVRKRYAEPDHVTEKGAAVKLVYSKKGVLFWTDKGEVIQMVIFKPY